MSLHIHPQNILLRALDDYEEVTYSKADHARKASLPNLVDPFLSAGS